MKLALVLFANRGCCGGGCVDVDASVDVGSAGSGDAGFAFLWRMVQPFRGVSWVVDKALPHPVQSRVSRGGWIQSLWTGAWT